MKPKLFGSAAPELSIEKTQLLSDEMLALNIAKIKAINLIYIFACPGFILQTIFLPKAGVQDQFTPYYILVFSLLIAANAVSCLLFRFRRQAANPELRFSLRVFILLNILLGMSLTFLDLHYGQELSLYILNIMFLSAFLWLTFREFLLFGGFTLSLLVSFYLILSQTISMDLSHVMPGVIYFIIAWAVFSNINAVRTENFLNRISIEEQYAMLATESTTDPLTGLLNRRPMKDDISREQSRVRRYGDPFSLFVIDIDYFKKVNDTYGHMVGDNVIRKVGELLKSSVREYDKVYRFGGEEFVVLLPGISGDDARELAERLRKLVETHHFSVVRRLTVSIGIISCDEANTVDELLKKADKNLYMAKAQGRNQVVG